MFGTVEREDKGKHREKTEGWKTDFAIWFQKCKEKAKDLKVRDFYEGPKISICPTWMEKKGKFERKTVELTKLKLMCNKFTNILLTFQHKFEIYHIYKIYMRA